MNSAYQDGPRLLADIGADHARFALETAPGRVKDGATLPCAHYRRFEDAVVDYLASVFHSQRGQVRHAVVAIAESANAGGHRWPLSIGRARAELGFDTLLVISDSAAHDSPRLANGFTWLLSSPLPALSGAAAMLTAALARSTAPFADEAHRHAN